MKNRREFVKQAVVSLVFVGAYLKGLFKKAVEPKTLEEQNLQKFFEVRDCDISSPRPDIKFGKDSMSLVGSDDYIEVSEKDVRLQEGFTLSFWHHFIYNKVGNKEETYIDGKLATGFGLKDVEIINFRREQVGLLLEEEFWFRRKDADSISKPS